MFAEVFKAMMVWGPECDAAYDVALTHTRRIIQLLKDCKEETLNKR